MGGFKGCLQLGLIVCGLWISPTWGFTKGQACGVLYSAEDFGGETFNVTEGSSFSDLEDECVRPDAAWNATLSFQVEAGCTLNACNESNYEGECRDFKEGMTRLSEELFNNVMSVSCSCPRISSDDGNLTAPITGVRETTTFEKPEDLPTEPRDEVGFLKCNQLFSTFLGKFAEQARTADERNEKMMLQMKEDQRKANEWLQQMLNAQVQQMRDQLAIFLQRKKQDEELEKSKADDTIAEMRRAEAAQRAMLDEQKRQAELENERSRLQMEQMNVQLQTMLGNQRAVQEESRTRDLERDRMSWALENERQRKQEEAARHYLQQLHGSGRPPPKDCLRQGTLILMADLSEKPVEQLEVGEMILDHKLNPVRVSGVLEKFLLSFSFHGFDNETFFFTDTHQLVGTNSGGDLQIYVKELDTTLEQNPLLSYLNVQALPERTHILRYNGASNSVLAEEVSVFTDPIRYPPTTVVFMILVEGESGTYFANGFACRHDIPPLERWPNTMAVLFALSSEPEVQVTRDLPYNLETLGKIEGIINGGYVRLQEILEKEEEEETEAVGVVPEGSSLSDQVLLGIFENPTYSAFVIGIYGKLGPVLALRLDEGEGVKSEMEIRRIQFVAYEGLKEYFSEAFASSF